MSLRTFGKVVDADISYENGNIIIETVGKKDKELNQLDAWGVYVIDEKDTAPKLLFGYNFSTATGGTWFGLS